MKRLRASSNLVFVVLGLATASVAAGCGAGSTSATGGPAGVTRSATAYCSYFYGKALHCGSVSSARAKKMRPIP